MAALDPFTPTAELPTDGVPIRPAATVVLLADRPHLEVLTLRRSDQLVFAPDHTVFPGGVVDQSDHDPRWSELATCADPDETPGLAHRVAAVRETIEEVGVLVGTTESSLLTRRHQLEQGQVIFADLIEKTGGLDLSQVHAISRWVTPMPGPRRYDAYFFVAPAPANAAPAADGGEAVEVAWLRPAQALQQWATGELTMIPPPRSILQRLAGYQTTAQVLAAAAIGGPPELVRIGDEHSEKVYFPADPGYHQSHLKEGMGWVWLPAAPA